MRSFFYICIATALTCGPAQARTSSVLGILTDKLELPVSGENPHGVLPPVEFVHIVITPTGGWLAKNGKGLTKARRIFEVHEGAKTSNGPIVGLRTALLSLENSWSSPALLIDRRVPAGVRARVFSTFSAAQMSACVVVIHGSRAHCVDPDEYRAVVGEAVTVSTEHSRATIEEKSKRSPKKSRSRYKRTKSAKSSSGHHRVQVKKGTGLSKKEIRRVLSKFNKNAQRCYQKKLPHRARLKGSLVMKLLVNAKGKVIDVGVAQDNLKDRDVAACIMDELYGASFRRSGSSRVDVEYPYYFKQPKRG